MNTATFIKQLSQFNDLMSPGIRRNSEEFGYGPTGAYADLMFAYGFAFFGENDKSQQLIESSRQVLENGAFHAQWLFCAFVERIEQVRKGDPQKIGFSEKLTERLRSIEKERNSSSRLEALREIYRINRLREKSRILEPWRLTNAFGVYYTPDKRQRQDALHQWSEACNSAEEIRGRLLEIFEKPLRALEPPDWVSVFCLSPILGANHADLLFAKINEAIGTFDAEIGSFLECGLLLALYFKRNSEVASFTKALETFLAKRYTLGMDVQIRKGLAKLPTLPERSKERSQIVTEVRRWASDQTMHLRLAAGWFFLHQEQRARPILQTIRGVLRENLLEAAHRTNLACNYLNALEQASWETAVSQIQELLPELNGIRDTFITRPFFCLAQLQLVDHLVIGMCRRSEKYTLVRLPTG